MSFAKGCEISWILVVGVVTVNREDWDLGSCFHWKGLEKHEKRETRHVSYFPYLNFHL